MPHKDNPQAWLWAEIARRFGDEAANALHTDYLTQWRRYNHRRHNGPSDQNPTPRKKREIKTEVDT